MLNIDVKRIGLEKENTRIYVPSLTYGYNWKILLLERPSQIYLLGLRNFGLTHVLVSQENSLYCKIFYFYSHNQVGFSKCYNVFCFWWPPLNAHYL